MTTKVNISLPDEGCQPVMVRTVTVHSEDPKREGEVISDRTLYSGGGGTFYVHAHQQLLIGELPETVQERKERVELSRLLTKYASSHDVRCEKFIAMWDGRLPDFPANVRCTCTQSDGGTVDA